MGPGHSRLGNGTVLSGRYKVVSVIGRGGMGTVYLAEDLKLRGKRWAIKETQHVLHDYQRFIDEAEMLIRLHHRHLPGIVDYFPPCEDGYSYLVMDYIEGETLAARFTRLGQRVEVTEALAIAKQLCELFHYLHDELPVPMIYRDLKPSNIMMDSQDQVRLIDFGIARHYKTGGNLDTVQVGTIGFAAPEQFEHKQTDRRTDLYSLGAVLYFLLSGGKYPYSSNIPLSEINEDVSPDLSDIVGKLLMTDPARRYSNAREVRKELERVSATLLQDDSLTAATRSFLGPVVIAVCGTGPGTGSTHTAVLVAHFLARKRRNVALVEANGSGDFSRIECTYEGVKGPILDRPTFNLRGVRYAKADDGLDMIAFLSGPYDFIVLDLGSYMKTEWFGEFLRAAVQIVVSTGAEWKRTDILSFFEAYPELEPAHCSLFMPVASKTMIRDLRSLLPEYRVIALPVHSDPFCHQQDTAVILEEWLGLAKRRKKKSGAAAFKWFRAF
ncbi:serine/threonine-protein kinase [Paenibacillus lutrae]